MSTQIFVNLPVKNLDKTVEFFTALGFTFNPKYTDKNATCMIIGENIFAMLLVEEFFKTFTKKQICDATTSTEVLIAISRESRADVDDIVRKAVAAGGRSHMQPQDHGFMYSHGFEDLDSHVWEVMYLDPAAEEPQS